MARIVQGQNNSWQLSDQPIGSGDAGEVYDAAAIDQPDLHGVLKTPARIATLGTIQRQASQIYQERHALVRLNGLPDGKVHPPRLLDEAQAFTIGTANYFIISETAQGESLASMLFNSRQSRKPFPHRVIITVMDALFDLFSRAHRVGVLWNDVKLEHIYWHDPTSEIAVIDWGNAIFLDNENNHGQRTPPRWQDYRQFVDTLGGFLQSSAPDLYDDLGWDEFQGEELDAARVSVLARRIAYQQQVLKLKEMEYQSLTRVLLRKEPTLDNLVKIQKHINGLNRIGAPWPQQDLLNFGQKLIVSAIGNGETDIGVEASALIWEIIPETLDLSWHLLKEYFQIPEILTHTSLSDLIKFTFNEKWPSVLWTLAHNAQENDEIGWWNRLIPVIRQKAMGTVLQKPIQVTQSLLSWAKTQDFQGLDPTPTLEAELTSWSKMGADLDSSPFDYTAMDLLPEEFNLPQRTRSEIKRVFNHGVEHIQQIIKGWKKMDWDILPTAFRSLLCWDPERWGLITLYENILTFQDWMKYLHAGPKPGEDVQVFLQDILQTHPPIDRVLGHPSWFVRLLSMLKAFREGAGFSNHLDEVKVWCPWMMGLEIAKKTGDLPDVYDESKDRQDS